MNTTHDKLTELLSQNQFELIPETIHTDQIKLIYLMNDAVESFLVFQNASMTGEYQTDYEGELKYDLAVSERSHLVVHQGTSVCTIFYDALDFEMHLYNYGRLGHFWVSGYEYLRLIEYRISILRDKWDYIGEDACNDAEKKLLHLTEFPPLNYNFYPSASRDYIVERENSMIPSASAIAQMLVLAEEAGDRSMKLWLKLYQKHPNRMIASRIAAMLHKKDHARLEQLLDRKIREASQDYPDRDLGPEMNEKRAELLARAEAEAEAHEAVGFASRIVSEEPFTIAGDDITLRVYVMSFYNGFSNRTSHIQRIEQG